MEEKESKPQIDLEKYRNHKRRIPWGLIRKLVIGTALVLLLFYFINQMKKAESNKARKEIPTEIEVDIED